jgi:hypothetical protein
VKHIDWQTFSLDMIPNPLPEGGFILIDNTDEEEERARHERFLQHLVQSFEPFEATDSVLDQSRSCDKLLTCS